jgi:hypothetical protein
MTVEIPVKSVFDPKGFNDLEKAAKRAEREAIASTRRQISEHKKVAQLTAKLDKDLAGPKPSFKDQIGDVVGRQIVAAGILKDVIALEKDFIVTSVQSAAAAERLGTATDNLGRQYGVAGDAIVASIQKASQGTVSQVDAMQSANQAMLLGVAKNEEEFGRLTQVAVGLGRAMGQDAKKSVEDLTIGIGRQSRLILDNLGLIVNADAAYIQYAVSVGKSVNELTEAEKKQAFLNAALSQGERKLAQLGPLTLDNVGKVEKLTASWADFQVEFGRVLLALGDAGAAEGATSFIDKLGAGAQAWQSAIDNINLLVEAQDRLAKKSHETDNALEKNIEATSDFVNTINPLNGLFEEGGRLIGSYIFQQDALAQSVQEVVKEEDDLKKKQDEAAESARKFAEAEEAAAQALIHAAKVAEISKDAIGKMIDIQDKATADSAEVWDDYFKDEAKAWKDHGKAVDKINADSAKEQQKIQNDKAKTIFKIDADLFKDLAKIDKDLAKDKAKLDRDTNRQISRMQQDAARAEKQDRRQRQIEAKGDQRLFDFEMRQLAAEGEFNQILASKERRAIEQQIAKEQSAAEQKTKDENQKIEIDRVRQDAADRKAEMEAEAEEAKQTRRDQAEEARQEAITAADEAEARRKEELAQALADEQANYEERLQALRDNRDEKLAEIEETKAKSLEKLGEELAAERDLSIEEKKALIPMAGKIGEDVGASFAKGMYAGFAREQRIDEMLNGLGSSSGDSSQARPSSRPGAINQGIRAPMTTRPGASAGFGSRPNTLGFAAGVEDFLVPPGFPNDSFQVGLTSGERVSVKPAGGDPSVVINVNGIGGKDLAAIMERHAKAAVAEYHDTIITPWTNAG